MPELAEIEHLRQTLEPHIVGARVAQLRLYRPDIVRQCTDRSPAGRIAPKALLSGRRIARLARHGKQLAILSDEGPVVCVHLGMSGQLIYIPRGARLPRTDHVHCLWRLEQKSSTGRMVFRDPRRFGGLWAYESEEALLSDRWSQLGPDALSVTTRQLRPRLARTSRSIKAALLDQSLVAGLGNIYVDEVLFRARIDPRCPADLAAVQSAELARSIRATLKAAIAGGGSTIRDYVDASGRQGAFTEQHAVYGRGGQPCVRCGTPLEAIRIAQRTTVFCRACQGP